MESASTRLRLAAATAISWRTDGSLVVGFNDQPSSAAVRIAAHAKQVAVWLSLLDGSRTAGQLTESGQALGIPGSAVADLLTELRRSGHVYAVETINGCRQSSQLRDLRHAAAVRGRELGGLLAQRQNRAVLICGAGPLPAKLVQDLQSHWLNVGWLPESAARIRPEDLESTGLAQRHLGKTWNSLARQVAQPALVIAVADVLDTEQLELRFANSAVLPVVAHQRRIAIGPLLNTSNARCSECLTAERVRNDPDWTFTLTQLLHTRRQLPSIGEPWLGQARTQVVAIALQLLDEAAVAGLAEASLELIPPEPVWRWRYWPATGQCNCASAPQNQLEQLAAELGDPRLIQTGQQL